VKDVVTYAVMILAFATGVTAHVAIAAGLVRQAPRARAAVAFFVPPLAPVWAAKANMRAWAIVWVASATLYVLARLAS
jgi:hypothetical protein